MNINQLEYLVAAVSLRSYARAAKSLFLTPQAVSRGIADLENELGIKMFAKSGRGIEATPDGALLAEKAVEIIRSYDDFKRYAELLNHNDETGAFGSLSIVVASSPYEGAVIPGSSFDRIKEQYPGIALELTYSSSGTGLSALYDGLIDASVVLGRIKMERFSCVKLFESELQVAVGKSHPLARRSCVSLSSLKDYPIARSDDLRCCHQEIVRQFGRINLSPRFIDLPPSVESHRRFLSEEDGVIFALHDPSLLSLHPDTNFIPLDRSEQIGIPVCLAWQTGNKDKAISLIQKSLLENRRKTINDC
jgi:DNA-binding transcriptional LysR family regulator